MVGNDKDRIKRSSSGSSQLLHIKQKPKNSSHSEKNIEKQFQTSADIERGRTADYCDYEYSYFEHFFDDQFSTSHEPQLPSASIPLPLRTCGVSESQSFDFSGKSVSISSLSLDSCNCDWYVISTSVWGILLPVP
jgi:hypothetical protein